MNLHLRADPFSIPWSDPKNEVHFTMEVYNDGEETIPSFRNLVGVYMDGYEIAQQWTQHYDLAPGATYSDELHIVCNALIEPDARVTVMVTLDADNPNNAVSWQGEGIALDPNSNS